MSSKSSQDAMVAQVTNSSTSASGYMIRPGSRSSESSEKCSKSSARRARGKSSSTNMMLRSCMIALLPNQPQPGNHVPLSTQNHPNQPVNLTSEPCLPAVDTLTILQDTIESVDEEIRAKAKLKSEIRLTGDNHGFQWIWPERVPETRCCTGWCGRRRRCRRGMGR